MQFLILGINHQSAPVEVRDALTLDAVRRRELLRRLTLSDESCEAVALSTCNRIEAALCAIDPAAAGECVIDAFCEWGGLERDALRAMLYRHTQRMAFLHLFKVICGLDSMALGETEIAGQVREAYEAALEEGAARENLRRLFDQAFHANKQVRTQTNIGKGAVSISHMAVDMAEQIFGGLGQRRALVLGAGQTGQLTVQHLKEHGVTRIGVANRTPERARALAEEHGLEAVPWDGFAKTLDEVDIVISGTSSPDPVLTVEMVRESMRRRRNRQLLLLDIAAPRDIEAGAGDLYNVFLYNIDDLQQIVDRNMEERRGEIGKAMRLIEVECDAFENWIVARDSKSVIVELRGQYDEIRRQELERLRGKLNGISAEDWLQIEQATQRIMNKYLDPPTRELRNPQGRKASGGIVDLIRGLFEIKK
ncbi:glutamyl-tRNA reductase [Candidatus Sumerlaeota bacterium]|nr:glutamyl-tRNA reductase [Candidatus Sumerlaeota bacterium]